MQTSEGWKRSERGWVTTINTGRDGGKTAQPPLGELSPLQHIPGAQPWSLNTTDKKQQFPLVVQSRRVPGKMDVPAQGKAELAPGSLQRRQNSVFLVLLRIDEAVPGTPCAPGAAHRED